MTRAAIIILSAVSVIALCSAACILFYGRGYSAGGIKGIEIESAVIFDQAVHIKNFCGKKVGAENIKQDYCNSHYECVTLTIYCAGDFQP